MSERLIGRFDEIKLLSDALQSNEAELIAVFGRRRVGKTFLIQHVVKSNLVFECSGIHNSSLSKQLINFTNSLASAGYIGNGKRPSDWFQAFQWLTDLLKTKNGSKKKVLFLDEFPWLHTHRSGFLQAFEHFWNTFASRQENLVVIICGSAASWMIKNVVNNRGGLHNRITKRIRLLPFTLMESESYLRSRDIRLDRYQLLQLYMVMGGIPQYLKEVRKGESATQAIDRICFTKDGLLHDEFKNLYYSLFELAGKHIDIIRALAQKSMGLTRNEIIESCRITSGGRASIMLNELEESGFITPFIPFNKTKKEFIYRLTDEYSGFYLRFIEHGKFHGTGSWITLSREPSMKSWSGYAFESICLKHIRQIKKALEIGAVYTEISAWRTKPVSGDKGAQIDLLIDRQDRCINVCEIKYSSGEFTIDKKYQEELSNKLNVFRTQTKTNKTLFLTMITTFGVKENVYKTQIVQNELTMNELFM
jgi:hypothetical protein